MEGNANMDCTAISRLYGTTESYEEFSLKIEFRFSFIFFFHARLYLLLDASLRWLDMYIMWRSSKPASFMPWMAVARRQCAVYDLLHFELRDMSPMHLVEE